jgi:asparagine synthetase B (glutamine-hydrolysing)
MNIPQNSFGLGKSSDVLFHLQADPNTAWLASFAFPESSSSTIIAPSLHKQFSLIERTSNWPENFEIIHPSNSLQTASQPNAGCFLIFDGHLYNQNELSRLNNCTDCTAADLVLKSYLSEGENFLGMIKGIYSILLWDMRKGIFYAVRDRLGFQPLFFTEQGNSIIFSNSVEPILDHPGVSRAVNRVVLAEHLIYRWPNSLDTYFQEIQRIPLGHYRKITLAKSEILKYWSPSAPDDPDDRMREEDLEEFDTLLDQAVERCFQFGQAGIFLSGGLDSVSIAAVAMDQCHRKGVDEPLALSVIFPHAETNEEKVQRGVAAGLKINQTILPFQQLAGEAGLLQASLEIDKSWPMPIQNPWRPVYFNLAAVGKGKGCQVILTGGGGDDWLTVNPAYIADLMATFKLIASYKFLRSMLNSYNLPRLAMLRYCLWEVGYRPIITRAARMALSSLAPSALYQYRRARLIAQKTTPEWIAPDPELRKILDERLLKNIDSGLSQPEATGPYGFYKQNAVSSTFAHPFINMDQEEDYEVGRRLGLKVLHPYWDSDLIQFLCKIPPRLLLQGGREKGLVRRTIARRFPGLGFERQRKISASTFFQETIINEYSGAFEKIGSLQTLETSGIIDKKLITLSIDASLSSPNVRDSQHLWELLNLESWARSRNRQNQV